MQCASCLPYKLCHKLWCFNCNTTYSNYLAFLRVSMMLSLKCFSSSVATGGEGLEWATPNEWSSDVLPRETPRTFLNSPDRVYFGLPNVIGSNGRQWGNGGISAGNIELPRFELFPELTILLSLKAPGHCHSN